MRKVILLSALLVLSGSYALPAHAGVAVSLLGNGDFMTENVSSGSVTASYSPAFGAGGGVLVEFPLASSVGFETGLLYTQRGISLSLLGTTLAAYSFPYLQAPLMLNYWISPAFALEAGGYLGYGVGVVSQSQPITAASGYSSAGFNSLDYGLSAGAKVNIALGSSAGFLISARYNFGLAELYQNPLPGVSTKWSGFEFLAGIRFGGDSSRF